MIRGGPQVIPPAHGVCRKGKVERHESRTHPCDITVDRKGDIEEHARYRTW